MSAELAALGDWLAVPSVVLLWCAVLLRAPSAVRSPEQRGLLLAVATAAAAMTLNLPDVVEAAQRDPDTAHLVGLVRNLIGVLSAGVVLYFVSAATRGRRLRLASARPRACWARWWSSTPSRRRTGCTGCRRAATPCRPSRTG